MTALEHRHCYCYCTIISIIAVMDLKFWKTFSNTKFMFSVQKTRLERYCMWSRIFFFWKYDLCFKIFSPKMLWKFWNVSFEIQAKSHIGSIKVYIYIYTYISKRLFRLVFKTNNWEFDQNPTTFYQAWRYIYVSNFLQHLSENIRNM